MQYPAHRIDTTFFFAAGLGFSLQQALDVTVAVTDIAPCQRGPGSIRKPWMSSAKPSMPARESRATPGKNRNAQGLATGNNGATIKHLGHAHERPGHAHPGCVACDRD